MQIGLKVFSAILSLGIAVLSGVAAARVDLIALKSGETAEVGKLWWEANCRSLLKGPPISVHTA